jgi:hypothetical protein
MKNARGHARMRLKMELERAAAEDYVFRDEGELLFILKCVCVCIGGAGITVSCSVGIANHPCVVRGAILKIAQKYRRVFDVERAVAGWTDARICCPINLAE